MIRLTGIFRRYTQNNHAIFQIVTEDDSLDKLESANTRLAHGNQSDLLDLELKKEPEGWRKPYTTREFTIKIPPKKQKLVGTWHSGLELIIWGKAAPYKFEKKGVEYCGWNITLKKFEKTSIVDVR